jgi:lysyl-tRNA synthetase class 2
LLACTRAFFDRKGFTEVSTDAIVPAGAVEGTIDPIRVRHSEGTAELHTSPEIEMKRLLGRFPSPIYQICKCFRDDPATPIHRKEFTMLEYYRPHADYRQSQADMRELLDQLAGRQLATRVVTVRELIGQTVGIDLEGLWDRDGLAEAVARRGVLTVSASDSWEDIFFKLLIERIEPSLPPEIPVLVTDYPVAVSVLSEAKPGSRWAERFEIYWQGMELCNGCTELTDAAVLRQRLRHEQAIRAREGKAAHPDPAVLLAVMDGGLPPASGVAVGLDRLFTALKLATPG